MSSFRGLRNGVYYGGKVRLVHAIVMTLLFKKGTLMTKLKNIISLTFEHARNLGLYVFMYKSLVCILNRLRCK
jgi:peroxisomal membrane protein 4